MVTGCSSGSADTGLYKDGTYEGMSDKGIHPGLKVAVTVQNGKIVETQSTEVDATSGATLTSTAIKEAVNLALEQAKK